MFSQASVILSTGGGGVDVLVRVGGLPGLEGAEGVDASQHLPPFTTAPTIPHLSQHLPPSQHPPFTTPDPPPPFHNTSPSDQGIQCAGGTHPTGMHTCV